MEENKKGSADRREFEALRMIGAFLLFLGVTLIVAVYFTTTMPGKMVNLLSGVIFLIAGVGAMWVGGAGKRKFPMSDARRESDL